MVGVPRTRHPWPGRRGWRGTHTPPPCPWSSHSAAQVRHRSVKHAYPLDWMLGGGRAHQDVVRPAVQRQGAHRLPQGTQDKRHINLDTS